MKSIFLGLLYFSLIFPLSGQQNLCPPNGVSTNPDAPSNPIMPQNLHQMHQNDHFDWRDLYLDAQLGQFLPPYQIINPNYDPNGGTGHLSLESDYFPEEGWELLYVDLGLDRNGNWNPQSSAGDLYIILYNKYRGIIRVFVAIVAAGQNSMVEIELSMNGGNNTALLASIDKVQQPLRNFNPANIASNTQIFSNNFTNSPTWFYADFPVNYDPCTCENFGISTPSMFKFKVELQSQGLIELTGTSSGTIKMIEKQSSGNTTNNWNNFYGTTKKIEQLISAGRKGYKTFDIFKGDAKNTANGKSKESDMISGIDNLGSFLTDNIPELKAVPYISEALSIVDFFVGGSKKDGSNKVVLPPMSIQLEHSFTGSLTFLSNYVDRQIYIPGSSFTPQNTTAATGQPLPNGDPRYPIYNEILGVYTLLEKPIISVVNGKTYEKFEKSVSGQGGPLVTTLIETGVRKWFSVDQQSIKLAINPASDLTLEEAYFQLNVTDLDRSEIISSSGGSIVNDSMWTSFLTPLACAEEYSIIIDEKYSGSSTPTSLSIDDLSFSLVLSFKNSDGDKFLHKSTWDAEFIEQSYPHGVDYVNCSTCKVFERVYYWFDKFPFDSKNNGFLGATQNLNINNSTIDEDVSALETIIASNSTITATAVHPVNPGFTDVIAGHTIDIQSESDLLPNSDLQINRLGRSCDAPLILATAAEINNICNSNEYQAQKIQAKIGLDYGQVALQNSDFNFITFPNPADDYVKIALSENFSGVSEIHVTVKDMIGRVIQFNNKLHKIENHFVFETAHLRSGLYLLEVTARDQSSVKKIFID